MKEVEFLGNSLKELQDFPENARRKAGFELWQVQQGFEPRRLQANAFRRRRRSGIAHLGERFRILYIARLQDAVYVLRAFQKKTQTTAQRDIEIARKRLKALIDARTKL